MTAIRDTIGTVFTIILLAGGLFGAASSEEKGTEAMANIKLPEPKLEGPLSLEQALKKRRSVREYRADPLKLEQISQLLWAAQGVTDPQGLRTAPSAGGLYPLEIYLLAGQIEGLAAGVYRYLPLGHTLSLHIHEDVRDRLADAALGQDWVRHSAAVIVIAAAYERTTKKYGDRGMRYVYMEAGHAGENLLLQAASLGLGSVVVGAFDDSSVKRVLRLSEQEYPLSLLPVGLPPEPD